MKLFNIRLSEEDARRIRVLRRAGVEISQLFRDAVRAEFERRQNGHRRTGAQLRKAILEIHRKYPVPPDAPRPVVDTTDRRAVAAYIRQHLESRRPR